jgi:PAS domain S-box-containing protein
VSEQLQSRELARLRLQFEWMPLGCILLEPDMTIADWNPSAERIFGWQRDEVLGRDLMDLVVAQENRLRLESFLRDLVAGEKSDVGVNDNFTRDGRRIVREWHDTPLRDGEGRAIGVLAMVGDVSDRVAAEEELRASRARRGGDLPVHPRRHDGGTS